MVETLTCPFCGLTGLLSPSPVTELRQVMADAASHLRVAMWAADESDDPIIMQHVRAALAALEGRPQAERPEESA